MEITAVANIDNLIFPCVGEINIHWIKEPQAYITWKLFCGERLIASKSENFFYKKNIDNEKTLINRVISKIEHYRIGRNKIFKKVKLASEKD